MKKVLLLSLCVLVLSGLVGCREKRRVSFENDKSAFEKAYNGLQGWVDCFEKASLKGMVGGGGIDAANTAASHVDVMKKAYELGKKL